jgi:polysaccharide biosynthesis transport protein
LELSAYLQLIRRWWWTLLLAAWIAGLIGFLLASQIPPSYEARARLLVGPINADQSTVRASESLSQTYAELATTEPVLDAVVDRLQLPVSGRDIAGTFSVSANPTTRFITIRAFHQDPAAAAALANAIGETLVETTSAPGGRPEGEVALVDPAATPFAATGPNVSLMAMLAGATGLLIAGMLAAVVEYLSNTVRSRNELAELAGAPVLGEIGIAGSLPSDPRRPLIVEAEPESRAALGYRLMVSRMPLDKGHNRVRSILIVGAQAGDRSGEFAANLSAVLGRSGRSVTLIDADDLEGLATRLFDLRDRKGISDLIGMPAADVRKEATLDEVRVDWPPAIDLIPVGQSQTELLQEDTARQLLDALKSRSELVVVSGAPVHRSAFRFLPR